MYRKVLMFIYIFVDITATNITVFYWIFIVDQNKLAHTSELEAKLFIHAHALFPHE